MATDEHPPPDELADTRDLDNWSRGLHGTFAEHATPDNSVPTVPADEYLAGR